MCEGLLAISLLWTAFGVSGCPVSYQDNFLRLLGTGGTARLQRSEHEVNARGIYEQ
jgi:hypothetical protein